MQGQKPPTAEESRRLSNIKRLWCIPCAMDGWDDSLATIQHLVEGRKRCGHEFTYGSCEWHHLGITPALMTEGEARILYGPSLQHGKRVFESNYGPERGLVEIQNVVLAAQRDTEAHGGVFTSETFGMIVRDETYLRLGRTVSIGR